MKAPSKSGYFSSVNVKVYGFLQFKGIEKSGIAGMMSVMDLMSFRDLYGYMTAEKAEEIRRLKETMAAREVDRESAEAELFGSAAAAPAETRSARHRRAGAGALRPRRRRAPARTSPAASTPRRSSSAASRSTPPSSSRTPAPRRCAGPRATSAAAAEAAGLGLKVVDWQEASGLVGQFVTLLRVVLFTAVVIFFAIALVIINNAMVMATLQRVKEIGTMRAIGTQRRFVVVMLLVEIGTIGVVFGLAGAALGGGVVAVDPRRGRHPGGDRPPLLRLLRARRSSRRSGRGPVMVSLAIVVGGRDPLRALPRPHRDEGHARRGDGHGGLTPCSSSTSQIAARNLTAHTRRNLFLGGALAAVTGAPRPARRAHRRAWRPP